MVTSVAEPEAVDAAVTERNSRRSVKSRPSIGSFLSRRKRSSAHKYLAGVHDKAKESVLGRLYAAVLSSTVQHVPPTVKQLDILSVEATELSESVKKKRQAADDDDATAVRGQRFGICYVTWRLENLRSGSFAMLFRAFFSGWSVLVAFQNRASPSITCKQAICDVTGACGSCLPNEDCLPKVDELLVRTLRENGTCPSYMGVTPTATFPLLPDHVRAGLDGYDSMMLAQTTIRFVCELGAILCVCLAWWFWAQYPRSKGFVRAAFGLALMPPFVLALTFPLQLGLNENLLLGRMCDDVTALISEPGRTPNETKWALDLDLPPRAEFCKLPPKQWGPRFDEAMKAGGVVADFNSSAKTRGLTCGKAEERRKTCESGFCEHCFKNLEADGMNARNPCIDFATMSQLCLGRDEKYKEELSAACPGFSAIDGNVDVLSTKCNLQGSSYSTLATGGYADPLSYCGISRAVMLEQNVGDGMYSRCTECYKPMRQMNMSRVWFADPRLPKNPPDPATMPLPEGADENSTCISYCSSTFTNEMLGERIAPGVVPDLCAGRELLQHLGAVRNLADAFDAAKAAFGVSILLQTIITLAPASLSLVLGLIKGAKVLKSSLPWMRGPSYQIVVSTAVVLPLIVSIMAGIFQIAADLWSLGFSVCMVLSFLHNFPTTRFLEAKSYVDTTKEMKCRGYIQTLFFLLAIVFIGCWIAFSERLKQVLQQVNIIDVNRLLAIDKPNTPLWTLIQIVLDFFGKAVVAKMCFCDLLLQMLADTELAEPSSYQRVMRDEVHVLYSIGGEPQPTTRTAASGSREQTARDSVPIVTNTSDGQVVLMVTK